MQNPLASAGNDQAWSYLGPFGDMCPNLYSPTSHVLAGWMRIGASLVFSFDGGLTFPIQTPLVGDDGSGPDHVVCRNSAHAPNNPGDTRVANAAFAKHKGGRHGKWGTDRKFYWTEPADGTNPGTRDLYVCKTADFGVNWTGIKHSMPSGPASDFVVSHSAFDQNGTFYVLHGDKLYVSFNQGESFAFVHTLPRYGSARRSDPGSDQSFVVDCGTVHIGLLEDAGEGRGNVFYLRGSRVDTATPSWEEELVDQVGNVRLDFLYIILDGNGVPTISYTTPDLEVTTASRKFPVSIGCVAPVSAVSRKTHPGAGTFEINLPLVGIPGVECRSGGASGVHQVVVTFPAPVTVTSADVASGTGLVSSTTVSGNQVFVNLNGVANAQTIAIRLVGVNGSGNVVIPMSVLLGDTTANGAVNSSDVGQTKAQSGAVVTSSNFRTDVTVNGAINSSDVTIVKAQSGTALPPSQSSPNE